MLELRGVLMSRLTLDDGGRCEECDWEHPPGMPHDKVSLYYRFLFFMKFRREPTWIDAVAHCSEPIKDLFIKMVRDQGMDPLS